MNVTQDRAGIFFRRLQVYVGVSVYEMNVLTEIMLKTIESLMKVKYGLIFQLNVIFSCDSDIWSLLFCFYSKELIQRGTDN